MKNIIIIILFFPLVVLCQTIDTLGITGGTGTYDVDAVNLFYTKIPGDSITSGGTLLKIGMKRQEVNTMDQKFALYSDNSGTPGTLLDTCAWTSNDGFGGWIYFDVVNGATIISGTSYWIALNQSETRMWYAYATGYDGNLKRESGDYPETTYPTTANPTVDIANQMMNAVIVIQVVETPATDEEKGYGGYGGSGGW